MFGRCGKRLRSLASTAAAFTLCAAGLGLLAAVPGAAGAHAQPDSTSAPATPAVYGTWGAGIQASPLFGASVRYNLSRRVALQAAGLPGFWGGSVRGVVGGRALYRLIAREGYGFFAAGGVSVLFEEQSDFQNGLDVERQVEALPVLTGTIGIETDVGDHVGLSAEGGGVYVFDGDESYSLPALGIGLHYYW